MLRTGLVVAAVLLVADQLGRRAVAVVLAADIAAGLTGPAAYAVQSAADAHTGCIPSAGPTASGRAR